jgi:RNA polymerase sigma-70 factor, ECF subfamily
VGIEPEEVAPQPGSPSAATASRWAVPPAPWGRPEQALLGAELRAVVVAAIDALPGRQRRVLTLRDVEGWGAAQVCGVLGLSETNQRVLLHRARAKVRQALEEYLTGSRERDRP